MSSDDLDSPVWQRHPDLLPFLSTHHRVISTTEAASIGLNREVMRSLVALGVLTRVARGAYVQTSALTSSAYPSERHALRTRAMLRSRPGVWAASHYSAAALWDLPLLKRELDRVHLCHAQDVGSARRRANYTVHTYPGADQLRHHKGAKLVEPATAVVGTALVTSLNGGVVTADAALHQGIVADSDLQIALQRQAHVTGVVRARLAVELADGRSESPGESLLRLILADLGIVAIPQYLVRDGQTIIARVDLYLPELAVVLEFDGAVKYGGAQGKEHLVQEKQREDRIRRLGYGVGRVTWTDLQRGPVTRIVVQATSTVQRGRLPKSLQ